MTAGYAPDGDTVRFVPDRPSDFARLERVERIRAGRDGSVSLRLEGVDAPELHYLGEAQPLGERARDALVQGLGERGVVVASRCDPHGRVVAYVFAGEGSEAVRELAWGAAGAVVLRGSANAQLLARGDAYPLAYRTQPAAHRAVFAEVARGARRRGLGVWALDRSARGVAVRSERSLGPHGALVLPKLFRRCVRWLQDGAREAFTAWLARDGSVDDVVWVDGVGRATRLSRVVLERGGTFIL